MKLKSPVRRALTVAAASVVAILALSGCSSGSSSSQSADLKWALISAPQSLDNAKAISAVSYTVQAAALETLTRVASDGSIKPWLAKSWSTPDDKTIVFKLRDDVKFWNGDPMTAEDVAYSLNRLADPASLISYTLTALDKATATAKDEVTVTLKNVDPLFLPVGISTNGFIVQKSFAEKAGKQLGGPEKLTMGTGPYEVSKFSKTSTTVLKRYSGYWGKAPGPSSVTFSTITDPETMRIALTQGQVDGTFEAPLSDAARYEAAKNLTTSFAPGVAMEAVSLDVRSEPFNDIHVRKAIALAISKPDLVTAQLKGHGTPSDALVTAAALDAVFGKDGKELTSQLKVYKQDVAAAKAELAKSAHPDGLTIPVEFADYDNVVFQVLQQQLAAVDIKLEGKSISAEQFYDETGKIDQPQGLRLIYTGYGSLDPGESLLSLLGPANDSGYTSPTVTAGLDVLATSLDEAKRKAAVVSVSQDVADNVPWIPLYNEQKMLVISSKWKYADFKARSADWIDHLSKK